MRRIVVSVCVILVLVLAGCGNDKVEPVKTGEELKPDWCIADSDCVCGGVDKQTERCFLGNKEYYEKHVDKGKTCPDFCGGIDGNLEVRCVDNRCTQMYGCLDDMDCQEGQKCVKNRCVGSASGECSADKDCIRSGCSGTVCQSKSSEPMMTTCEYKEEYECYQEINCGCVDGTCMWRETADFRECIAQKQK